jgi:hypothetical protein
VSEVSREMITRKLSQLQRKIMGLSTVYKAMLEKLHQADTQLLETFQAESMIKSKLEFKRDVFERDLTTANRIEQGRIDGKRRERTIRTSMAEFDNAVQTYIELAVRALRHPEIGPLLEHASAWNAELDRLNEVRERLNRKLGTVHQLRYGYAAMSVIWAAIDQNPEFAPLYEEGARLMTTMTAHMKSIRSALSDIEYPFDHARGQINLGEFLLDPLPDAENPGEVYGSAERLLDRFFRLQARILGRKCLMGESVLSAIGLAPLPEPATDDESADDDVSPVSR